MADDKIGLLALAELRKHPERYRGDPGEPGKKGRPGIEGKAGDPGLTWRGTFAYGTTYQPGDVVEWEGSSYVALVVTARRPPDPEWDLLAAKGEAGASGRGYIRGGGGSGAGVTDHGALTGLADNDHPQYIPQGGPLTEELFTGAHFIRGADADPGDEGGNVTLKAGESTVAGAGGKLTIEGVYDDQSGGYSDMEGGTGAVGKAGGSVLLDGGAGDDGNDPPSQVIIAGGDGAGNPGRFSLRTDDSWGGSGDLLTAQGDGTALWVPPAASGAPADAAYYVTTASGGLSAEVVVPAFIQTLLDDANAATARTTLGLGTAATTAATDYQPIDSDLTAIAALTTTAFGRALLALADPADGTKYLDGTGAFSVPTGGLTQPQVMARMTGA